MGREVVRLKAAEILFLIARVIGFSHFLRKDIEVRTCRVEGYDRLRASRISNE